MPHIRPDKIDAQITNLDITKQGVKDVGSQGENQVQYMNLIQ